MKRVNKPSGRKLQLVKEKIGALDLKNNIAIKGGSVIVVGPPPPKPGSFGCI